jgi:hypothetical protein
MSHDNHPTSQPTVGRTAVTSQDYPEESSDEPANIMEISLDIADELKITIKKKKCGGCMVIKYDHRE